MYMNMYVYTYTYKLASNSGLSRPDTLGGRHAGKAQRVHTLSQPKACPNPPF